MRWVVLGLLLTSCASNGAQYITITQDTKLFCLPPEVGVVEYECGWSRNQEGEISGRLLCPRGYIHKPGEPNTCRRIDVPIEKIEVK